ncbi:GNAT family N-acetyltransferase [Bacillus sp. FJAT-29953]|nr:GNAT family N-acetyltransferase [Bacillus sp. FJAT-29953]
MFSKLVPNDPAIAAGSPFTIDEVQYNLIHRISEDRNSLCLKTPGEKVIFAQTPWHKGWLWISNDILATEQTSLIHELINHLTRVSLPGITGDPQTAQMFAGIFSKINNLRYETEMTMEAYHCPTLIKPQGVKGEILKATDEHVDVVADYLAGFMRDAFGTQVEPSSQQTRAATMIAAGGLYLWIVNGHPVAQANISHRSPRHARINAVFTPTQHRKHGYASALVAELCKIIESENRIPMLYADVKNPDSNKVYQNIGFQKCGLIEEIKFF